MGNSIFSTYSQGENRVTSTIISVFSKVNFSTLVRLFQYLLEDNTIELVKFENQIKSYEFSSVPDARISGSFNYLIETKVYPNKIDIKQVNEHLKFLKTDKMLDSKLLLLTPDSERPKKLEKVDSTDLYWVNFDKLIDTISISIEEDKFMSEREKYLLLELQEFIIESNLNSEDISEKVLIVPASIHARQHYERLKVYICQPNRTFQKSSFMGFYGNNVISKEIPKIIATIESFDLMNESCETAKIEYADSSFEKEINRRLKELQVTVKEEQWNLDGSNKIIFLSRNEREGTVVLDREILNNKRSKKNK